MASSIIRTFSTMMKEYRPDNLLDASLKRYNWIWNNFKKDKNWLPDQVYKLPIEVGEISNASFGALTDAAKITELQTVMGEISAQPEAYFAAVFNHKDIDADDLKGSFLKLYPEKLNQFKKFCSSLMCQQFLNGPKITELKAVADGGVDPIANDGLIYVDYPERLRIGQKVALHDTVKNLVSADCYIKSINKNTGAVVLCSDISLATVINFTTGGNQVTEANDAALYVPGSDPVTANNFTSISSILLPSGVGDGTANYAGKVKASYPFLQAVAIDGADIDETNIIDKLMDGWVGVQRLGDGEPNIALMSLKNANSISKLLKENFRGAYSASPVKSVGFGQKSFMLNGPEGDLEIVAIREMRDDIIPILDKNSFVIAGSKFFEAMDYGNGDNLYAVRSTTGVKYITDLKFYGDLICKNPSHNGIIYNVAY